MSKNKFGLLSGGRDSIAAVHKMFREAENDKKNPVAVYLDTGIGLDENRQYVEDLCDKFGWQLWTLRTHEDYEELVKQYGFPGPSKHTMFYAALKERQLSKLGSIAEDPHFYTGIRASESQRRMGNAQRTQEKHGAVWHSELIDWSLQQVKRYIKKHDIPENPLWDKGHFKDCGCGAFGSPEELLELQADYPEMYERLSDLEDDVDRNDEYCKWGWGQLSEKQLRKIRAENDDGQMTLCSVCGMDKLEDLEPEQ